MCKQICLCSNETQVSMGTKKLLYKKLIEKNFNIVEELQENTALLISIGGDGATLNIIQRYDFPSVPIIGINTGHLGFFQEINPKQLDNFISDYIHNKYALQPLATVKATIRTKSNSAQLKGLNEIVIRSTKASSAHLNISIDDNFIERFSGDGIVISTPAGSTAYNYSIGGAIVDPRLKLLQLTPIAPMNTTAYRSFTSSLLLPPDRIITVSPDDIGSENLLVINDGFSHIYEDVIDVKVEFAKEIINLLRFESYKFWDKVTSKFL